MEFANNDTKLDLVLSDVYIGGKLLARVQAQRRAKAIQELQQASNFASKTQSDVVDSQDSEAVEDSQASGDLRTQLKPQKRRNSILTLQVEGDSKSYVVMEKKLLTSTNPEDVEILRNVKHYSIYAVSTYFKTLFKLSRLNKIIPNLKPL